jgi:hypothetical protein
MPARGSSGTRRTKAANGRKKVGTRSTSRTLSAKGRTSGRAVGKRVVGKRAVGIPGLNAAQYNRLEKFIGNKIENSLTTAVKEHIAPMVATGRGSGAML